MTVDSCSLYESDMQVLRRHIEKWDIVANARFRYYRIPKYTPSYEKRVVNEPYILNESQVISIKRINLLYFYYPVQNNVMISDCFTIFQKHWNNLLDYPAESYEENESKVIWSLLPCGSKSGIVRITGTRKCKNIHFSRTFLYLGEPKKNKELD